MPEVQVTPTAHDGPGAGVPVAWCATGPERGVL